MSIAEQPTQVPDLSTAARSRTRPWAAMAFKRFALVLLPVVTIGLLVRPMVFTPHAPFAGDDWLTHLWYLWHQGDSLRHGGLPSFYVNYAEGAFYPHFAFYGGTLNVIAGAVSAALGGDGLPAYVMWWVLGFAVSYGAWLWLGRMAGLGWWAAQAPALLFVTSAYYITLVYARGDWPEFVAASFMAPVGASSISVVRADRLRALPAAALAISVVLFTGSHNITLAYGGAFLVVLLAGLLLAVPAARRMVTRRGLLRWLGVVVPACLVNAWFLVPAAAYQHLTRIGATNAQSDVMLHLGAPLVRPQALFTLERASGIEPARQFAMALPVLAMAWVLISLAVALVRRAGTSSWRRTLLVVVAITAALTLVMMDVGLVLALPAKLQLLQFNYRLESYVLMGIAAALLAALVLMRGLAGPGARAWVMLLVPIMAFSLLAATRQVERYPRGFPTSTFNLAYFPTIGDFADGTLPELEAANLPHVDFAPDQIKHDRVTVTTSALPGQYLATNLLTLPKLVHIDGAKIVGASTDHSVVSNALLRHAVLQIDDDATPGAAKITVSAAHPLPVVAGRVLSLIGLLGLAANFVAIGLGWRRRRRARGQAAAVATV